MEEELEKVRQAKKRKIAEALEELKKQQELEAMKKALLVRVLTPEAYERIMNIRLSKRELYDKAVEVLAYLYQTGKINEQNRVSDDALKNLLLKMVPRAPEPKIEFKRKSSGDV